MPAYFNISDGTNENWKRGLSLVIQNTITMMINK